MVAPSSSTDDSDRDRKLETTYLLEERHTWEVDMAALEIQPLVLGTGSFGTVFVGVLNVRATWVVSAIPLHSLF